MTCLAGVMTRSKDGAADETVNGEEMCSINAAKAR